MYNYEEKITNILKKEISKPMSYEYAIKNVFIKNNKFSVNSINSPIQFYKSKNIITSFIVAFMFIIVISSGFVFAKDIEHFLKHFFNNSTKAINEAVTNGYIQKENTDFIYDNDIGIKINSLFYDTASLNIAFSFMLPQEHIKSVSLNDISITTDNNKLIYKSNLEYKENLDELPMSNYFNGIQESIKLSDNEFTTSTLIGLKEHNEFNKLFCKITKLRINYEDNTNEIIDGNWYLEISINENMKQNANIKYSTNKKADFLESCTATLNPSGMIIELKLLSPINTENFIEYWNKLISSNNELYVIINNKKIIYNSFNLDIEKNSIILNYNDIGLFTDKIETITLVSELHNKSIILEKE